MSDLKERYLYAVTKELPRACRKDAEAEILKRIEEKLAARCGENAPAEEDLHAVLEELGTPAELVRQYSPDANKALIEKEYYVQYKRWAIIIVCAVVGSAAFSNFVDALMGEMQPLLALAQGIAECIAGALSAIGAVTLLFAILQKKGAKMSFGAESIENLPPVPKKKDTVPVTDSIVGIALSVFAAVVLLCFPQTICIGMDEYGCYSAFDAQQLQNMWLPIVLFALAGVVRHGMQLIWRKRTVNMLIATAVCDVMGIACLMVALMGKQVMDPEFMQVAEVALQAEEGFVQQMVMHFNVTLAVVISAAIGIDLVVDAVKTLR